MTYRELLNSATKILCDAGISDASSDAWILFSERCGLSRSEYFMHAEDEITNEELINKLFDDVRKRADGCPVQYITGKQNFCGLDFFVSPDTLIPRFDTEVLTEIVLKEAKNKTVLDMCTGTGCILISLCALSESVTGVGSDISEGAVELAKKNAEYNGVADKTHFFAGDLFNALTGTKYESYEFDIIVSNPPYIKDEDIKKLDVSVKNYEPIAALSGHSDGLWFYEKITEEAGKHLKQNGLLAYETGYDEGKDVSEIMKRYGYTNIRIFKDYAGLDRVVTGRKGN